MSTQRSSRILLGLVGAATVAALVVPGTAFAKGTPGGGGGSGGGGGGGGGGGEETTTNSLSVPAIYVGAVNPSGLTCNGTYREPTGVPLTGYPVTGYYYVQGVHSWQAGCLENEPSATVTAAWGDNLGGDAMLKVGSPIRVEMGLLNAGPMDLTGFTVVKLQPDELDRLSAYGTKAIVTLDEITGELLTYESDPVVSTETRVWAAGAHLKIYSEATGAEIVDGPASAEINATGRVVYGYNLRVPAAGNYVIEYTFPNVTIISANRGVVTHDVLGDMVSFTITVGGGGGGGGGGHRP